MITEKNMKEILVKKEDRSREKRREKKEIRNRKKREVEKI